jgi:hypothetical protein
MPDCRAKQKTSRLDRDYRVGLPVGYLSERVNHCAERRSISEHRP